MTITIKDELVKEAIKVCGGVEVTVEYMKHQLQQLYLANLEDDVNYLLEV